MRTSFLNSLFPARFRSRGSAYARAGRVGNLVIEGQRIAATVQGSEAYFVEIEWNAETLDMWCDCPAYERFESCKHAWAVLCAAGEERGDLLEHLDRLAGAQSDMEADAEFEDAEPENTKADRLTHARLSRSAPAPVTEIERSRQRLEELRRANAMRRLDVWRQAGQEELRYVIDQQEFLRRQMLALSIQRVRRKKDGSWGQPIPWTPWDGDRSVALADPRDRRVFALLHGVDTWSHHEDVGRPAYHLMGYARGSFYVSSDLVEPLIEALAATGRLYLRLGEDAAPVGPLPLDEGPSWRVLFRVRAEESGAELVLTLHFARDGETLACDGPQLIIAPGFLFTKECIGRIEGGLDMALIGDLRRNGELRLPAAERQRLTEILFAAPEVPLVEGLEPPRVGSPVPHLWVEPGRPDRRGKVHGATRLETRVSFRYGEAEIDPEDAGETVVVASEKSPEGPGIVRRDRAAEAERLREALALGLERTRADEGLGIQARLRAGRLTEVVAQLLQRGWVVEAEDRIWRSASSSSVSVRSGVDWFELEGLVEFDGESAPFPKLLAAVREGKRVVELGDGSVGLLPDEWLARWSLVALAGEVEGDHLRFTRSQGPLLDALLAQRALGDGVVVDKSFERLRQGLARFRRVRSRTEPRGFRGELWPYQRKGLGWLHALERLGLGGCLADDMGLGKTVQVLAFLEGRRGKRGLPSLVVAPRSLIFNWMEEARRFAPKLTLLDYTGPGRAEKLAAFDTADLVLTTYGTLRQDAALLAERRFDVCVLDEAQAIKNSSSLTAKAARLVRAEQRLALSGTPIENHLGELWSLLEFLNPGLLGKAQAFKRHLRQAEEGEVEKLAGVVAPFFLRRRKEEVLDDLPEKTEQVLSCELGKTERRDYDELREHYRQALLPRADREGIERVQIQVLEALLRLRQAACHPGLIDRERAGDGSAKLDLLLTRLDEVVAEGNKALVFSQFTTLLKIVRSRLEERGIPYAYLDGRTRKREECVRRFQEDPDCPLFLISLKAGGVGLNLTAADYVFLLDPWWNPAVEQQAIDRVHRIGCTHPVMAYRLIARDTVEERVRELQEKKRGLADAVLGGRGGGLAGLTREDLATLLGG